VTIKIKKPNLQPSSGTDATTTKQPV